MRDGLNALTKFTTNLKSSASGFVDAGMDFIVKLAQGLMASLPVLIEKAPTIVSNIAKTISENAPKLLATALTLLKTLGVGLIKAIPTLIKNIPKIIKAVVDSFIAYNWMQLGGTIIKNLANGVRSMSSKVASAANLIKSKLLSPIEAAKTKIKGILDTIRGFFPLSIGKIFSNLKIPKITVSGGSPPYGIGGIGEPPKFNVTWFRKAMNNAMLLNNPTIFGYGNGSFLGGGEAGQEVVAGSETLMNMVQDAVASQNENVVFYLQKMTEIMAEYFPQVVSGIDRPLCFDADGMASAMAVPMDKYLGKLRDRKDRGR
jgi:hypothetical protein